MPRRRWLLILAACLSLLACLPGISLAQVAMPESDMTLPVRITARTAQRWTQGNEEVWVLRGECRIAQGADATTSDEAVVWINRIAPGQRGIRRAVAYLEGKVSVHRGGPTSKARMRDETWFGQFESTDGVEVQVGQVAGAPPNAPDIFRRATARRIPQVDQAVRRTQYTQYDTLPPANPGAPKPAGTRRIRWRARSNVWPEARFTTDPVTSSTIGAISGGVTMIVDGLPKVGTIDLSADRLVVWTVAPGSLNVQGETWQGEDVPLEIYLEGNIVFRQGLRVIYADRMYYDVKRRAGVILDAELLTDVPKYDGKLRLNTRVLEQRDENHFFAQDSFITSSRMGKPGYRIEVGDVAFEDIQRPRFDPVTGAALINPDTNRPVVDSEQSVSGRDAFLYVGDVPIFYWPAFATNLEDPSLYIRRIRMKNDSVFGTQILTDWDAFQLFGVRKKPEGTEFDISADYLSDRGFGHGAMLSYARPDFFGFRGATAGLADFWGIYDHGEDNLGRDRRSIPPEKKYRFRAFWQHRQELTRDWRLTSELGWISDRNFLEEYYEREWDELKDESTGLELRHVKDNRTFAIAADSRMNAFFTQTEAYPRLDHFWLGQPLFGSAVTWFEHSQIGYERYRIASAPDDPVEQSLFAPLPWEATAKGERAATTHEIDWPIQLGPVKAVPYALGQLAHWGQDLTGNDMQRAAYQVGLRASLPMWRVDPSIENDFWNVHGLAHKIVFDAEASYADANRDMTQLPLYDAIDDDAIEAFQRRMAFETFGVPGTPSYPIQFDPRYYALRTGMAGWVTSPSLEVFDDMAAVRLGARQRWQTKRGMPGQRHIIDWVTLDTNAVFYPNADRDNFGTALGLANYNFAWHVGDRLTLASDGIFDFFDEGQKIVTVGAFLTRPPRGSLYAGFRVLEGPIHARILSCSYTYRMSEKWVSSAGMSIDLGKEGNIGQQLAVTRIGESLLISAGFNVDASRGNVGAMLAVEPRFLPKSRLGRAGGASIPVAGVSGLE